MKLQPKLFLSRYFERASKLTKQRQERTNNKGEKPALARRRQACTERDYVAGGMAVNHEIV